jgi:hypothetical protein
MKFVKNNKILEDSNAENAGMSAEKTKSRKLELFLLVVLDHAFVSVLSAYLRASASPR